MEKREYLTLARAGRKPWCSRTNPVRYRTLESDSGGDESENITLVFREIYIGLAEIVFRFFHRPPSTGTEVLSKQDECAWLLILLFRIVEGKI